MNMEYLEPKEFTPAQITLALHIINTLLRDAAQTGIPNHALNAGLREETFLDRLISERDELAKKLEGLRKFLDSGGTANVSAFQSTMLNQQERTMNTYLGILNDRIDDLTKPDAQLLKEQWDGKIFTSEIDEPIVQEIETFDIDKDGPVPFNN